MVEQDDKSNKLPVINTNIVYQCNIGLLCFGDFPAPVVLQKLVDNTSCIVVRHYQESQDHRKSSIILETLSLFLSLLLSPYFSPSLSLSLSRSLSLSLSLSVSLSLSLCLSLPVSLSLSLSLSISLFLSFSLPLSP